jgi:hypothetical protein
MLTFASLAARCAAFAHRALPRARGRIDAFRADRGGNTTLIFALAVIPIFGTVGVAVEAIRHAPRCRRRSTPPP